MLFLLSTRGAEMARNVLVVYKKNFEEVHDRSLENIKDSLDKLVSEDEINVG